MVNIVNHLWFIVVNDLIASVGSKTLSMGPGNGEHRRNAKRCRSRCVSTCNRTETKNAAVKKMVIDVEMQFDTSHSHSLHLYYT